MLAYVDRDATKSLKQNEGTVEAKAPLREIQRQQASRLTQANREEQSAAIRQHLTQCPLWESAIQVLAYMPLKDEPNILPLMEEILKTGKILYLPRFDLKSKTYHHARIEDVSLDLQKGQYGIPEPSMHCPSIEPSHMDLTLVPGLAFDSRGWRLGRGKGFYDRMLAGLGGTHCGIAFDFQMVESVPHETLDQKMDWIITPEGALKTDLK